MIFFVVSAGSVWIVLNPFLGWITFPIAILFCFFTMLGLTDSVFEPDSEIQQMSAVITLPFVLTAIGVLLFGFDARAVLVTWVCVFLFMVITMWRAHH